MKNKQSGFTLIEVLVALIVVGVALSAIIKTTSNTALNIAYIQQKTIAHWVALNRMTEVQLETQQWPGLGSKKDTVEMSDIDWEWRQEVKETPNDNIRRIEISVYTKGAGKDDAPLALLNGFLLSPTVQLQVNAGQPIGFSQQPRP